MSKLILSNNRKVPISRREARLELKYRGTLLCEFCNRHTEVDMEFYWKALEMKDDLKKHGHEFTFFCKRPRCIASRPETLMTHVKRGKPKSRD